MNLRSLVPWRNPKSEVNPPRLELTDPLLTFRREMDRMFDNFLYASGSQALPVTPALDVTESDKDVVITADLPGLGEKDLQVNLEGDILTIAGEKRSEDGGGSGGAHYTERRYGDFSRSLQLPFVPEADVEATCDKGVLTIRIPKPDEVQRRSRRIEVRAG